MQLRLNQLKDIEVEETAAGPQCASTGTVDFLVLHDRLEKNPEVRSQIEEARYSTHPLVRAVAEILLILQAETLDVERAYPWLVAEETSCIPWHGPFLLAVRLSKLVGDDGSSIPPASWRGRDLIEAFEEAERSQGLRYEYGKAQWPNFEIEQIGNLAVVTYETSGALRQSFFAKRGRRWLHVARLQDITRCGVQLTR